MEYLNALYHLQLSGPGLFLAAFMTDWFVMVFAKTIFRLYKRYKTREIIKLKEELKKVDMKDDFPKYAKLNRQLTHLQKTKQVSKPSRIWSFLRFLVPALIFRNCWICTAPANFWTPIQRAVKFPHPIEEDKVKVGFIFFWGVVRALNNKVFALVYK
ncbi:hypothetical protein TVAG_482380 [Trichomonas vaginalis G3]|uniref:Tail-anchored protein insertion receptor WRB n=1 Tax=Trichomonas vaginalis (strain ATCC PRA-98 / G3) TaxID=412133 RepID=A2EBP7_TRIV3|nr:CHD5-like protein family [Trichomonas vaginalis G3]EAY09964.1 hypothetical protein TVAG_482380 [Trichomonas vaginalis G3]KAI5523120.1 CHD5-like protein family [Trichomonas vaginalis G3]|eukprot:XP_001322187.1 hypothetical protein [Trichomonas vaginalis G3]